MTADPQRSGIDLSHVDPEVRPRTIYSAMSAAAGSPSTSSLPTAPPMGLSAPSTTVPRNRFGS